MESYRILIIDDHPLVRSGICAMLELDEDLEVCGEAEDAQSAMSVIQKQTPAVSSCSSPSARSIPTSRRWPSRCTTRRATPCAR